MKITETRMKEGKHEDINNPPFLLISDRQKQSKRNKREIKTSKYTTWGSEEAEEMGWIGLGCTETKFRKPTPTSL